MTRRLAVAAVLAAAIFVAAPADASNAPEAITRPSPVQPLQAAVRVDPPDPPPAPAASPAHQVVDLLNAERARVGAAPLQIDERLMAAAQRHSEDQAFWGRMSHDGSDGSNAGQRITRAGFTWRSWAENVAYGYDTPAAVMGGWMGSPKHRDNNLSANSHVGVGLAYNGSTPYWTLVFATPR